MDISSIALQGLEQADAQLNTAAARIAGAASTGGAGPDTVSLSEEMVALMSAKTAASANIATLKTADQMQQNLIDITA